MSTPEIQRNIELHLAKGELREAVDLMMAATENSSTFWSVKKPLLPIQKSMKEVSGCLVLALERFFAVEGIYKRGSEQEKKISQEQYSTPWSQIEAAMAYQAGLPLFIMKDENIRGEGMLDPATHDWMIVHINPEHPEELLKDPIRAFLKSWVEEVRAFHATL